MTDYYGYPYIALTGGGDGALDSLDGSVLKNGDFAVVIVPGSQTAYIYTLDEDSALAESSPNVIAPDANAGDKRWILVNISTIVDASSVNFLQSGTGATTRTIQSKAADFVDARDFGVVADGTTDDTDALNAAIVACSINPGTRRLVLPHGTIRCDGQLLVNVSGISITGQGRSASSASWGTMLDLRYSAGHQIIIGGAAQKLDIEFKNLHIYSGNGGDYYTFESRYVRGLFFRNISFGGVYGFLKAGRASEPTLYVSFEGIEGNMRETGSPVHEHFMDAVNVPGMLFFGGHGHVEGYTSFPAGSCFLNYGVAAEDDADGIQIDNWTIRNFDTFFNFRCGVGNFFASNVIGDFCSYGLYADSDIGNVIGINVVGSRFAGGPTANNTSYGLVVLSSNNTVESVQFVGNLIRDFGRYGIWVNNNMDVNIVGNKIQNVGQANNNTWSGIIVGADVTGQVVANTVISDNNTTNKIAYGFKIESQSGELKVIANTSIGHGGVGVSASRGNADGMGIRLNTGQCMLGKYMIGPYTLEDAANNVSGDPMGFAFAGGSTSTQHFRAIRRGKLIGITGSVNGNISTGTVTLSAAIDAVSNGNLTAVLSSSNNFNTNTYAPGIEFEAGNSLSVRYATTANLNPTTLDLLAHLEIVDD